MKKGGLVLFFLAIGALFGALITMILTLQSDKDAKESIREYYDTALRNLKKAINSLNEKIDEIIPEFLSKITSELRDMPEEMRSEIADVKEDTENKIDRVIGKLRE